MSFSALQGIVPGYWDKILTLGDFSYDRFSGVSRTGGLVSSTTRTQTAARYADMIRRGQVMEGAFRRIENHGLRGNMVGSVLEQQGVARNARLAGDRLIARGEAGLARTLEKAFGARGAAMRSPPSSVFPARLVPVGRSFTAASLTTGVYPTAATSAAGASSWVPVVFGIVLAAVVIGAIAYGIYKVYQKLKSESVQEGPVQPESPVLEVPEIVEKLEEYSYPKIPGFADSTVRLRVDQYLQDHLRRVRKILK